MGNGSWLQVQYDNLVAEHAYTVLGVDEIKDNSGVTTKIMQMRNPWERNYTQEIEMIVTNVGIQSLKPRRQGLGMQKPMTENFLFLLTCSPHILSTFI